MDPKMEPTWSPNGIKNRSKKLCIFSSKNASIFSEKRTPWGAQGDPKIPEFRGLFAPPPQDPPKDAKWTQNDPPNGAKMESKWSENGVKMELKSKEK